MMYRTQISFSIFLHRSSVSVLASLFLLHNAFHCYGSHVEALRMTEQHNFTLPKYASEKTFTSPINASDKKSDEQNFYTKIVSASEKPSDSVRRRVRIDETQTIPFQNAILNSLSDKRKTTESSEEEVLIDLETITKKGSNALHLAAKAGSLKQVKRALSHKIDINSCNNLNIAPIHLAFDYAKVDVAKYLIENGADLMIQAYDGHTILSLALLARNIELIDLCIIHAPNLVHVQNYDGYSPLHYAVRSGNSEIVKKIIETLKLPLKPTAQIVPLTVDCCTNQGATSLSTALCLGYKSIAELLVDAGASIDIVDIDGGNILHAAAIGGDRECIEFALRVSKNKLARDALDYEGRNVLHLAARCSTPQDFELFVTEGVSPKITTPEGFTVVTLACTYGNLELLKYLIERLKFSCCGNDDTYGSTPLHAICGAVPNLIDILKRKKSFPNALDQEIVRLEAQKIVHQGVLLCLANGADVNAIDRSGFSALHYAIQNDAAEETIELLLNHKAYYEGRIRGGVTPLLFALEAGNLPIVNMLIARGANINAVDEKGRNALHCAVQGDNSSCIMYCINNNIQLDSCDEEGLNALHYAARACKVEVIDLLINCGLNIDSQNKEGFTPLMYALASGNYPVAQHLIKRGARVDINGKELTIIAARSGSLDCIEMSVAAGGDIFAKNIEDSWSVLHWVSSAGNIECLRFLLAKIPREQLIQFINSKNIHGITPLMVALSRGHIAIAFELVRSGARMTDESNDGTTPLHVYCENSLIFDPYYRLCRFYCEKNPNVNVASIKDIHLKTSKGVSCLMVTARVNAVGKICELKKLGARIDDTTNSFVSPIMAAVQNGQFRAAHTLKEFGAKLNVGIANRRDVVHNAAHEGSIDCVNLCLDLGVDATTIDQQGWGLLHFAAKNDLFSLIERLVQKGISVDAEDFEGCTPLMIALRYGSYNTAKKLIHLGANIDKVCRKQTSMLGFALLGGSESCVRLCLSHKNLLRKEDIYGNTPFHMVSHTHYVELLDLLTNEIPDLKTKKNSEGNSALMISLMNNDEKMSLRLLEICPQLALMPNLKSITPLEVAVGSNLTSVVKALIALGSKASQLDHRGVPLIFVPLTHGNRKLAEILIQSGASPLARDPVGSTALFTALILGSLEGIELCLQYGIDPFAVNIDGWTAVHALAHMRPHWRKEVLRGNISTDELEGALLLHGPCLKRILCESNVLGVQDIHGWTPLHHAALGNDAPLVDIFNEFDGQLEILSHRGFSPLFLGLQAEGNNNVLFDSLMRKSDDSLSGLSPIHKVIFLSALYGDVETFKEFPHVNKATPRTAIKRNLLHYAAMGGNIDILKICLESRIPIEEKDTNGMTALHYAALYGRMGAVRQLIIAGASTRCTNKEGALPLHLAAQSGDVAIVNFLISKGCSIKTKTLNGSTLLHYFAQGGFVDEVEKFKEHGISDEPNAKNETAASLLKLKDDNTQDEQLCVELTTLQKILFLKMQQSKSDNVYTKRKDMYIFLRRVLENKVRNRPKEVKKSGSQKFDSVSQSPRKWSKLSAMPSLDQDTFVRAIQIMKRIFNSSQNNSPLFYSSLLHAWSYLSGIPVVGLKNDGDYYYRNNHLRWLNNSTLEFSSGSIHETNNSDLVKVLDVPQELLDSALFFRRNLVNVDLRGTQERQLISWPLLKDQNLPLDELPKPFLLRFLSTVLRLNAQKHPVFSLGIVNLFKNTALYLTPTASQCRILASPCSVAATSYLGFQDGIMLESGAVQDGVFEKLIGKQFFRRAFAKNFSDSVDSEFKIPSADFVPHFTFNLGSTIKTSDMNKFSEVFGHYLIEPEADLDNALELTKVRDVIEELRSYELQACLTTVEELKSKVQGTLIEFEADINLSGILCRTELDSESEGSENDSSNEKSRNVSVTFNDLLQYVGCNAYQNIKTLNLSHNSLEDRDVKKLGELLAKNLLPNLEELNLSNNNLSEAVIRFLSSLLHRNVFKLLILCDNNIPKVPRIDHNLLRKVVWLPSYAFNAYDGVDEVQCIVKQNHYEFYNRILDNEV